MLALVGAAVFGEKIHRARLSPTIDTISGQVGPAQADTTPVSASDARKIYPYSVIEGGASTVEELRQSIEGDPIVARHFAKFDLSNTRVETLQAPKVAHVSYRKGNDIFWTRRKLVIPAGETVLTDGTNIARTRCGNCLSEVPGPVSATEPAAAILDTPILVPALKLAVAAPVAGNMPQLASAAPAGSMNSSGSAFSQAGSVGGPSGGGTYGSSGPKSGTGAPAGSTGLQPSGDEVGDPGIPGGSETGSLPFAGAGSPSGPAAPSTPTGAPGEPQGPPSGPLSPPGGLSLPEAASPIVPPPFQGDPGEPLLPPIESVLPPSQDPQDPTEGHSVPPVDPGDPGNPGPPGDPGTLGEPIESASPVEQIPEPGTTALMLLGGALAVRRIRRSVS